MGANCVGSRSEVGCLRFDVLRASTESDLFVSYEARFFDYDLLKICLPFTWNIRTNETHVYKNKMQRNMRQDKVIQKSCWFRLWLKDTCFEFDTFTYRFSVQMLLTLQAFESPAAMDVHKEMPYTKAWGAFQYGDSWIYSCYPVISLVHIFRSSHTSASSFLNYRHPKLHDVE